MKGLPIPASMNTPAAVHIGTAQVMRSLTCAVDSYDEIPSSSHAGIERFHNQTVVAGESRELVTPMLVYLEMRWPGMCASRFEDVHADAPKLGKVVR